MSNSFWPCGLWPIRLLCPWDSPGKNTGVGCRALLQGIFQTQESNPILISPSLAGEFFTTSTTWEALKQTYPSSYLNSFKVAYKMDRSIVLQNFRITATMYVNYISVKLKFKKELWPPNWVVNSDNVVIEGLPCTGLDINNW